MRATRTKIRRCTKGNAGDAAKALLAHGADVDARAKEQKTPLHQAAQCNAGDAAKVLLAHVDARDDVGNLPLHLAVACAYVEVLSKGDWWNAIVISKKSNCLWSGGPKADEVLVHYVGCRNKYDEWIPESSYRVRWPLGNKPPHDIKKLKVLLDSKANIHAQNNGSWSTLGGQTPLHQAAREDAGDVVKFSLNLSLSLSLSLSRPLSLSLSLSLSLFSRKVLASSCASL